MWDEERSKVLFIGLNPSTADHKEDDPTIRRLIGFAQRWGFGGMHVCNLFAYKTPYPKQLFKVSDPVGPRNDKVIKTTLKKSDIAVLIYGILRVNWFGKI